MNRCRFLLVFLILAILTGPSMAGIIFWKKDKVDPSKRINALLITLKTETSERKRAAAAEELRSFDTATNPQIVPALIDAALSDKESGVRSEAVQSLGRIRPISQEAGWTLEQVLQKDPSMRVRLQARSSLVQYRIGGYHSPEGQEQPPPSGRTIIQTQPDTTVPTIVQSPPRKATTIIKAQPIPAGRTFIRTQPVTVSNPGISNQEPPLADPESDAPEVISAPAKAQTRPAHAVSPVVIHPPTAVMSNPMPVGPPEAPATNSEPPMLAPVPAPTVPPSDGPDLIQPN